MKTIEERANEAGIISQYKSDYCYDKKSVELGYTQGAAEQKAIDIDIASIILCRYACPHKIDSNKCFNTMCETWEIFRKMMEE